MKYGVWFGGRRTPVVVNASSRSASITAARKKKKRGGVTIVSARPLTIGERRTANKGRWVRTGAKGQKAGYRPSFRGKGPAPKRRKKKK